MYNTWATGNLNDGRVYAQAYSRLIAELGENAGLGITLTQWKQADSMIRNRANQLTSFTHQLARRSPVGIATTLGLSVRDVKKVLKTRYGVARNLSDLWLEFWFGWKPMVQDIYTGCEVFDNFIPWAKLKGSARREDIFDQDDGPYQPHVYLEFERIAKVSCQVRLVNPNARLLQQFGLLNAAQVAWDAVPWSFVVDWFANVNQWLGSFTDFAGFETSNVVVSRLCRCAGNVTYAANPNLNSYGFGYAATRTPTSGVPRPALHLKNLSLKPTRALTAITLLTQKLPR